ncbi:hypothetical protein BJ944DRAFT_261604 [Cunninghamella echinulata]|nr:hypothetical protein BJ944DRAFT_261604 [Cunninghamella echinulata]
MIIAHHISLVLGLVLLSQNSLSISYLYEYLDDRYKIFNILFALFLPSCIRSNNQLFHFFTQFFIHFILHFFDMVVNPTFF